jgi:hypothetical protein
VAALLRGFGADIDGADGLSAAIVEFARRLRNTMVDNAAFAAYAAGGRAYGP